VENFGEWFPGVVTIASSNALKHGQPGKQYLETVLVPLRGTRKITLEVREGEFFAIEGRFPPLMPRMEMELRETEVTTHSSNTPCVRWQSDSWKSAQHWALPR
jgi:hypothetical protein